MAPGCPDSLSRSGGLDVDRAMAILTLAHGRRLAHQRLWLDNARLTPEGTVDRILDGRQAART